MPLRPSRARRQRGYYHTVRALPATLAPATVVIVGAVAGLYLTLFALVGATAATLPVEVVLAVVAVSGALLVAGLLVVAHRADLRLAQTAVLIVAGLLLSGVLTGLVFAAISTASGGTG